jgi:hypothetical protein
MHREILPTFPNAISYQQKAVHLIPEGHADMPGWLNNLGISFQSRFEHTGDLADISECHIISAESSSSHS